MKTKMGDICNTTNYHSLSMSYFYFMNWFYFLDSIYFHLYF